MSSSAKETNADREGAVGFLISSLARGIVQLCELNSEESSDVAPPVKPGDVKFHMCFQTKFSQQKRKEEEPQIE